MSSANTCISVSYTHLDVYKRQFVFLAAQALFQLAEQVLLPFVQLAGNLHMYGEDEVALEAIFQRRNALPLDAELRALSLIHILKRFKRQCARTGVLAEARKREHYEKPSVKRKKKAEAARKRKY